MSISDFEQSLWELALLINPTHLANITTTKLNSYYQDTILDMRKVVLVQNLFNDIYNNWTDHQIRYQQNRRRQIENGEITEEQLLQEEMMEENESEIEYISDEEAQDVIVEERFDSIEFSNNKEAEVIENKENINNTNTQNGGVIITNDNTVIQLPVRKSSVKHKNNGKPIKQDNIESQPVVDNNKNELTPITDNTVIKNTKENIVENNNVNNEIKNNLTPSKEMTKKSTKNISENIVKEQTVSEPKENVKKITLDFSGKDAAKSKSETKTSEPTDDEKESKKSKKEHSRRKKVEREPRKDSLKANVKLSDEKCNEVLKELQDSGVITTEKTGNEEKLNKKTDSAIALEEKVKADSSPNTSNNSFVVRSFNIPSQQSTSPTTTTTSSSPSLSSSLSPSLSYGNLPSKQDPIPARKSSYKKTKPTYRLSDKDVSIKNKYKLNKSKDETKKEEPKVHLRPKKISEPPAMQRRSMDELLFQFADVMDVVSLIPHIVGDDDLLGNDLTFNSSDLNSKAQTKDSNGNVIEEKPRRRPSRAPTPPPTVVSNGKEYEIYSIPSERHQKYIKKKEEMEKQNKRRSSLKFEYHGFEDLKRQQELAGYDVSGDVPITDRKAREAREARKAKEAKEAKEREAREREAREREAREREAREREAREAREAKQMKESNSSKNSPHSYYKRNSYASSSGRNSPSISPSPSPSPSLSYSSAGSCGSTMKMDVLSGCMLSSSNSSSSNGSHNSKNSTSKRASRFLTSLTKSKSKSKDKEKEKEKNANKENQPSNSKNYLVRRKSSEKSSASSVHSHQRHRHGGSNQETSSQTQSSPSLGSSTVKKSYSSTTLSKYDLPHMSSLSSNQESTSRRYANGERSKTTPLPSDSGLFEGLSLSTPSSSNSSSKQRSNKYSNDSKGSSTSEIDKFFDNVFRIDWSL